MFWRSLQDTTQEINSEREGKVLQELLIPNLHTLRSLFGRRVFMGQRSNLKPTPRSV